MDRPIIYECTDRQELRSNNTLHLGRLHFSICSRRPRANTCNLSLYVIPNLNDDPERKPNNMCYISATVPCARSGVRTRVYLCTCRQRLSEYTVITLARGHGERTPQSEIAKRGIKHKYNTIQNNVEIR